MFSPDLFLEFQISFLSYIPDVFAWMSKKAFQTLIVQNRALEFQTLLFHFPNFSKDHISWQKLGSSLFPPSFHPPVSAHPLEYLLTWDQSPVFIKTIVYRIIISQLDWFNIFITNLILPLQYSFYIQQPGWCFKTKISWSTSLFTVSTPIPTISTYSSKSYHHFENTTEFLTLLYKSFCQLAPASFFSVTPVHLLSWSWCFRHFHLFSLLSNWSLLLS